MKPGDEKAYSFWRFSLHVRKANSGSWTFDGKTINSVLFSRSEQKDMAAIIFVFHSMFFMFILTTRYPS